MQIPFTSVTVLTGRGPDLVFFDTELTSTLYAAEQANTTVLLKCEQAAGKGVKWVRDTFGVEATVTDITPTCEKQMRV